MNYKKWIETHRGDLEGKKVVLFGASGGIGNWLSRYVLELGWKLVLANRSQSKTNRQINELRKQYPHAEIESIEVDLEEMQQVKIACDKMKNMEVDVIIHNAGAYSIPRRICDTGFDNVFQINFVSPYYITRQMAEYLSQRNGRVVVVGSIAHNYSKVDEKDIDFQTRKKASLVYGNAKRYLMYSVLGLPMSIAVTHPGITFTNITAHYPKFIFAIIKHPMKIIFMHPRKAAISIMQGCFETTEAYEWIGPRFFNVWGKPSKKKLRTSTQEEINWIKKTANKVYQELLSEKTLFR